MSVILQLCLSNVPYTSSKIVPPTAMRPTPCALRALLTTTPHYELMPCRLPPRHREHPCNCWPAMDEQTSLALWLAFVFAKVHNVQWVNLKAGPTANSASLFFFILSSVISSYKSDLDPRVIPACPLQLQQMPRPQCPPNICYTSSMCCNCFLNSS